MAETIARTALPPDPVARRAALGALLKPFVEPAVAACGESRQAALRSGEAGEKVANAQLEGGYWLEPLEAVAFANRGEPWRPLDLHEEAEALFFGAAY